MQVRFSIFQTEDFSRCKTKERHSFLNPRAEPVNLLRTTYQPIEFSSQTNFLISFSMFSSYIRFRIRRSLFPTHIIVLDSNNLIMPFFLNFKMHVFTF